MAIALRQRIRSKAQTQWVLGSERAPLLAWPQIFQKVRSERHSGTGGGQRLLLSRIAG